MDRNLARRDWCSDRIEGGRRWGEEPRPKKATIGGGTSEGVKGGSYFVWVCVWGRRGRGGGVCVCVWGEGKRESERSTASLLLWMTVGTHGIGGGDVSSEPEFGVRGGWLEK